MQYFFTLMSPNRDGQCLHIIKKGKGRVFMKTADTYKEPIIFDFDGARVRVFRPVLTESEYNRRMKIIHDAAAALLLSVEAVR